MLCKANVVAATAAAGTDGRDEQTGKPDRLMHVFTLTLPDCKTLPD